MIVARLPYKLCARHFPSSRQTRTSNSNAVLCLLSGGAGASAGPGGPVRSVALLGTARESKQHNFTGKLLTRKVVAGVGSPQSAHVLCAVGSQWGPSARSG